MHQQDMDQQDMDRQDAASFDAQTVAFAAEASPGISVGDLQWPAADLGGVTELRVHGVGGTSPASMLDVVDPVQVSGNRAAGMWRTRAGLDPQNRGRVEAYAWGGLNSRRFGAALWLLTLPFAMVNLAGWMAPVRHRTAVRNAVRFIGLGMTSLYVLGMAVATMDVVAYQCAGATAVPAAEGGQSCAAATWWLIGRGEAMHEPQRRVLVAALLPLAVVFLLWGLTHQSRRAYENWPSPHKEYRRSAVDSPAAGGLEHEGFWTGQAYAEGLADLHIAVGFTCVAVALAFSADALTVAPAARWVAGAGLATLAGAVFLSTYTPWREKVPRHLPAIWSLALVVLAVLAGLGTPTAVAAGTPLPGLTRMLEAVNLALVVGGLWLLVAAAVVQRGLGTPWRTWLRRSVTPYTVVTIAVAMSLAVQSGTILWLANRLGRVGISGTSTSGPVDITLGQRYQLLAASMLPFLGLTALAALGAWFVARRRPAPGAAGAYERLADAWRGNEPHMPAGWCDGWPLAESGRALRRSQLLPASSLAAVLWAQWAFAAAVIPAVGYYGWAWTAEVLRHGWSDNHLAVRTAFDLVPLTGVSQWLLSGLPVVALLVLRQALTNPSARHIVATAWDVATFWPRSFHPLAPPSYAERAVPEIQERISRIVAGHDGRPGAVLLLGHSQGSILVTAALASYVARTGPDALPPGRFALVTYGCPLTRLYAANFPAYFNDDLVRHLRGLCADGDVPGWRNFHRDTDYVAAGPLISEGDPDDVYLPDPPIPWHPPGDDRQPVRAHSETGYRSQGAFAAHVAAEIGRLAAALPTTAPGAHSRAGLRDPR